MEEIHEEFSSGQYTILSAHDPENLRVGRHYHEDKSLHPNAIYALERDETRPNSTWQVEHRGGDEHILKCNGAPTVAHDLHLFAILTEEPERTVWKINKQARGGYTIVNKEDPIGASWVISFVEAHDEKPIAVRSLIVFPTYPPTYP
ncbi:uncharacterized protein DFL_009741 [Arthrobotrys flagrans]|uniref:MIR domain-containing protein n=1 Tax=Arthrobotrys flagrans TaxID=97331 RepID=A0A436ZSI2_ARTFL|nr:hypothetical protein DFL_009741 [Arthrobotrys flagrans]